MSFLKPANPPRLARDSSEDPLPPSLHSQSSLDPGLNTLTQHQISRAVFPSRLVVPALALCPLKQLTDNYSDEITLQQGPSEPRPPKHEETLYWDGRLLPGS